MPASEAQRAFFLVSKKDRSVEEERELYELADRHRVEWPKKQLEILWDWFERSMVDEREVEGTKRRKPKPHDRKSILAAQQRASRPGALLNYQDASLASGLSERHLRSLVQRGILETKGKGHQKKIVGASLLEYSPPPGKLD